jgi:hypothetical protein
VYRENEVTLQQQEAADISNVMLVTTHTASGCGGKTHLHVQLNTGMDLTEVTLNKKYRHGFDIHRERDGAATCPFPTNIHKPPLHTSKRRVMYEHTPTFINTLQTRSIQTYWSSNTGI